MKGLLLFIVFSIFMLSAGAQTTKNTETSSQIWAGYFNQSRISNKWGFWLDAQIRTTDHFLDSMVSLVFRPGLTYYFNDNTRATAGYAYMIHFPADNTGDISQPEHRFWQQFQWAINNKKTRLVQRVRLEERFRRKFESADELADDYYFNYRFRYNLTLQIPISGNAFKNGSLAAVISDEVMVNFGKQVVYNYFDQNRFLIGLNYYIKDNNTIFLGYMHQFQQLATGNDYQQMNVLRVIYTHNLDFRKSESRQ